MLTNTSSPKKLLPILSNLDDIRIASPCPADWEAMTPVDNSDGSRARFCASCTKNVYDLSAMTRSDALALITRREGNCCVRFYRRADGTVLTEDCPVGLKAALKRVERKALAGMACCAAVAGAVVAFLVGVNPVSRRLEWMKDSIDPPAVGGQMVSMGAPPRELKGEMTVPVQPQLPPDIKVKQPLKPPKPRGKLMGKPALPAEVVMGDVQMHDYKF